MTLSSDTTEYVRLRGGVVALSVAAATGLPGILRLATRLVASLKPDLTLCAGEGALKSHEGAGIAK